MSRVEVHVRARTGDPDRGERTGRPHRDGDGAVSPPVVPFVGRAGAADPFVLALPTERVRQKGAPDRVVAGRTSPSDTGRHRFCRAAPELLQANDVATCENREMNHQSRRPVQLVQEGKRSGTEPVLVQSQRTELDQPESQRIPSAVTAEPPHPDETHDHPMG